MSRALRCYFACGSKVPLSSYGERTVQGGRWKYKHLIRPLYLRAKPDHSLAEVETTIQFLYCDWDIFSLITIKPYAFSLKGVYVQKCRHCQQHTIVATNALWKDTLRREDIKTSLLVLQGFTRFQPNVLLWWSSTPCVPEKTKSTNNQWIQLHVYFIENTLHVPGHWNMIRFTQTWNL